MRRLLASLFVMLGLAMLPAPASALPSNCTGKFVNPITDVCWSWSVSAVGGRGAYLAGQPPRHQEPGLPVCACGSPVPRIGIAVGFWEPSRLVDVTAKPWCFPNLGGIKLDPGLDIGQGQQTGPQMAGGRTANTANWQAHYYVYPLLYWLEVLTDFACLEAATFDVAYISEVDPLWNDDTLTTLINPEVALFANPIAVAACAADCAAATAKLPIDQMFWCDGCNGAMYPMNGNIAAHNSPVQSSRLAAERMLFKMHRMGLAWGTAGAKALCNKYLMPILKKSQYRIQMTNPTPTVVGKYACSPIGASTLPPDAGRATP